MRNALQSRRSGSARTWKHVPAPGVLALAATAALSFAGARAQSVIRSIGEYNNERFGAAICDAGDVNADGWRDYLVGEPNANGGRGGVVCISGKYLATGLAPSQLYSYYPALNGVSAGAAFGFAVAKLGDVTGDGVPDFAIGAPYHDGTVPQVGGVFVLDGATHVPTPYRYLSSLSYGLTGFSVSNAGDRDGDGFPDILAGSPTSGTFSGSVYLLSGRAFVTGSPASFLVEPKIWEPPQLTGASLFGCAVIGDVDFDGDGIDDIAVAAPRAYDATPGRGAVIILSGAAGHPVLAMHFGQANQHLGISLASGADIDSDGRLDLIVGAEQGSTSSLTGEAIVLSTRHLLTGVAPFEIYAWDGPPALGLLYSQFGASVAFTRDLSGDGYSDILVGMPSYHPNGQYSHGDLGAVAVYSGHTGARIGFFAGTTSQKIGGAVLGCGEDLDGDGLRDFIVGAPDSYAASSPGGLLEALSITPSAPSTYCVGKVNSLGCTPAIGSVGNASASSIAPFLIGASNLINNRNGLLFYGFGSLATPFQGGVLCVRAPTVRTVMQNSGGSASGSDCSGTFSFDFNALIQAGGHPQLVPGKEVFCQYWSRDPQSPSTTSLSDALSFLIDP